VLFRSVTKEPGNVLGEQHVDRTHHVPLLASALMDGSGGIAIDHRADIPQEYEKYLMLHESTELKHMQNLIKTGMKPQEAYDKAHDTIATPIEHAAVEADLGKEGLEKYKSKMREEAAKAKEPSDRERHPDAHTTRFNLDKIAKLEGSTEGATQTFEQKFKEEVDTIEQEKDLTRKRILHDLAPTLFKSSPQEPGVEYLHVPGKPMMERWQDKRDIRGI
jgi:hypothetical protein